MRRGDGEKMKRRVGLSQTYGFWMLAMRPVLDSFRRTSRSHKGASCPVFLLSVTFSEAIQRIEWSFQRHTIHEVGHKDLEAAFPSNVVGHDSVIDECPSEGISYYDDDGFGF
jgi:hypothetical protein